MCPTSAADADSLWLSTTRGICRIPRKQLTDFAEHRRKTLSPVNYGSGDGLRSAQCSPSFPMAAAGAEPGTDACGSRPAREWQYTIRKRRCNRCMAPIVHLVELTVDGNPVDLPRNPQIAPNAQRIQIRYTGVHLNAPEQVRYSYRLDGLDTNGCAPVRAASSTTTACRTATTVLSCVRNSGRTRRASGLHFRRAAAVL